MCNCTAQLKNSNNGNYLAPTYINKVGRRNEILSFQGHDQFHHILPVCVGLVYRTDNHICQHFWHEPRKPSSTITTEYITSLQPAKYQMNLYENTDMKTDTENFPFNLHYQLMSLVYNFHPLWI